MFTFWLLLFNCFATGLLTGTLLMLYQRHGRGRALGIGLIILGLNTACVSFGAGIIQGRYFGVAPWWLTLNP